jgi:hypothetical protein
MTAAIKLQHGRPWRIDPNGLPARFQLPSGAAAPDVSIYLDRTGVIVKRRLAGLPMTLSVPHSAYDGIAVRLVSGDAGELTATLELAHQDPALTVPLAVGRGIEDAAEDWQRWCQVLCLPMLLVEADGEIMRIGPTGGVAIGPPTPRRRTGLLTRRRPRFLVRRRPGRPGPHAVLSDWREIIARS